MNNDLVSIIMPSYNCEHYIAKSIESVLKQTYENFELIIIDDCSTDNTVATIKSFNDKRIKLFINNFNKGAALTRNCALRKANGRYVAFLDSDDIWATKKLEKQIDYMNEHNYSFTYTDYRICNNGIWENVIRTGPRTVGYRKLINYCYFFTSTVIYDRNVVGLIEIKDLKKNNDYAMWFHALKKTKAYRYPYCLSYYIKHSGSISSVKIMSLIKYHYLLFRVELGKTKFISIFLTFNNMWHGVWKKIIYKTKI